MPSPFDLEQSLSAPQAGPTAGARVARSNPFDALRSPSFADTALEAGYRMPPILGHIVGGAAYAAGGRLTSKGERARKITTVAQQLIFDKVRELQGQGLSPGQMMNAIVASDEFAMSIAELPAEEIMGFVQNTVKSLSPAPLETEIIRPGEQVLTKDPNSGRVSMDTSMRMPTTEEQNIAAIVKAEKSGDTRTATLLKQRLLTRDQDGEVPWETAIKLRSAGVKTGRPQVDAMKPESAAGILREGKTTNASMPTAALISRSLGLEVPGYPEVNRYSPEEAEAIVQVQKETMGPQGFAEALLGAARESARAQGTTVPGLGEGRKSIQQRREALQKGGAKVKGGLSDLSDEALTKVLTDYNSGQSPLSEEDVRAHAAEYKRRQKR